MAVYTTKDVSLGSGRTKICVPLTIRDGDELEEKVKILSASKADLVEWRVDGLQSYSSFSNIHSILQTLSLSLTVPIIFTCRTIRDGGKAIIEPEEYAELLIRVAESGYADLIDIELSSGDTAIKRVLEAAEKNRVGTIISYHNFTQTPPTETILKTLSSMLSFDCDIYKVAYMPKTKSDILSLMSAVLTFHEENADKLLLPISMGKLGVMTRVMAKFFSSPLTFATCGEHSAPGQLDAEDLSYILDIIE